MQLAFGGNKTRKLEYLGPDGWRRAPPTWCQSAESSPITPGRLPPSRPSLGWRRGWCRRALIDLVRTGEIGADPV